MLNIYVEYFVDFVLFFIMFCLFKIIIIIIILHMWLAFKLHPEFFAYFITNLIMRLATKIIWLILQTFINFFPRKCEK